MICMLFRVASCMLKDAVLLYNLYFIIIILKVHIHEETCNKMYAKQLGYTLGLIRPAGLPGLQHGRH